MKFIDNLIDNVYFVWTCWKISQKTGKAGFFTMKRNGIPFVAVFIARDREAWMASEMATRFFADRLGTMKNIDL